ncbi:transposase [Actinoplanes sp. NPDC051411]
MQISSDQDGAGRPAFLRSLTACGLSGVRLVISDAHRSLVST